MTPESTGAPRYPPPRASWQPAITSVVARATPAAPTRRAMRPWGDSFAIDFFIFHHLIHISFHVSHCDRYSHHFSRQSLRSLLNVHHPRLSGPDARELQEIGHGELPSRRRDRFGRLPGGL